MIDGAIYVVAHQTVALRLYRNSLVVYFCGLVNRQSSVYRNINIIYTTLCDWLMMCARDHASIN